MALIKAEKVEVEIQEQQMTQAGCRWIVILKIENGSSIDIPSLIMTNKKPLLKQTIDLGDKIINAKSN
jgi:hypothetical protein